MKRKPAVRFTLYLNDFGYTEADEQELTKLLANIPNVEVGRGIQFFPISSNVFFVIVVSGALAAIAGGFLNAIGNDLWEALKSKLKMYFARRQHHISLDLLFKNCQIYIPLEQKEGATDLSLLDDLDRITADVQKMLADGDIPKDGFYFRVTYLEDERRWIVDSATDKKVSKDYTLDTKTRKWSVEYRKKPTLTTRRRKKNKDS